jgi:hypothetical protein
MSPEAAAAVRANLSAEPGSQPGGYYPGTPQSSQVSIPTEPQQPGSQPGGGSQPGAYYTGITQSPQVRTSTESQQPGSQPGGGSQPGASYSGASQSAQISTSTNTQVIKSGTDSSSNFLPAPSETLATYKTTISAQPDTLNTSSSTNSSKSSSSVNTVSQPPVFGMLNTPTKISTTTSQSTVPLLGAAAKSSQTSLPQSTSQKIPEKTTGPLSVIGATTTSSVQGPDSRNYVLSSHSATLGTGGQCGTYAIDQFNQSHPLDQQFSHPGGDTQSGQLVNLAAKNGFLTSTDPNQNVPVGSMIVWQDKSKDPTGSGTGYVAGDGHAGIITAVSGNNLTIQDSNWREDGQIRTFTISKNDLNIESIPQSNPSDIHYYEFVGFILPTPSSASNTNP